MKQDRRGYIFLSAKFVQSFVKVHTLPIKRNWKRNIRIKVVFFQLFCSFKQFIKSKIFFIFSVMLTKIAMTNKLSPFEKVFLPFLSIHVFYRCWHIRNSDF